MPASSANIGPGFDSMGLALSVYDELIAMVTEDEGVLVEVAGEGEHEVPRDENHLVVQAMRIAFDAMGCQPPGFVLRCRNAIPHGRGLGSSAAAIIGGMALARAMVEQNAVPEASANVLFDDEALLATAITMESHPDNLAAALHGGFTVAWLDDSGHPGAVRLDPHEAVRAVLIVPVETLPTVTAREVLPDSVTYDDARHNLARSALLVHALTRAPDLLFEATSDRLHQQARAGVYPASVELVERLRGAGLAAAISGAGPSVVVLTDQARAVEMIESIAAETSGWVVREIQISGRGAHESPLPTSG
ncbi:MAG: homoserine kinase [Actinomycetota bacterium]|nr:homoserine kinase [Actinomycetota bacterium]